MSAPTEFRKQWDISNFTLDRINGLAARNIELAAAHGYTIEKKKTRGGCIGRLVKDGLVEFSKTYRHPYEFMNSIHIIIDVFFIFNHLNQQMLSSSKQFDTLGEALRFAYQYYKFDFP